MLKGLEQAQANRSIFVEEFEESEETKFREAVDVPPVMKKHILR